MRLANSRSRVSSHTDFKVKIVCAPQEFTNSCKCLQGSAELVRPVCLVRQSLVNSKGEAGLGQHELNVKCAEVLDMADRHVVYKQVCLQQFGPDFSPGVVMLSGSHMHAN